MVKKETTSEKIFDVLNIIFMLLMICVTLYPFYYVVMASLSDSGALMRHEGVLLKPAGFSLAAYKMVFKNPNILSGYRTTIIVVLAGTTINILLTSIGAFLLTRKKFAIRKFLSYMMIFTMYFSGGMIPTYLLIYKGLNLGDSLLALIIPSAISTYNLLIMRTNFAAIPECIEESAKIDGANDIVVLFRIIMPLSLPIIAVMILFYGVAHWNSWFSAMIYIRTKSKYPLQLILREILLLNSTESMMEGSMGSDKYSIGESIKYATIIVATLPILCVYPFIQKYFVKGMMIGAVKG
ncbi:MAG: carbohydrate ABC transporter permease [Clostridia bacterium]|nr:carbohydrate ABC transporter permease [Clostridia bacterium]